MRRPPERSRDAIAVCERCCLSCRPRRLRVRLREELAEYGIDVAPVADLAHRHPLIARRYQLIGPPEGGGLPALIVLSVADLKIGIVLAERQDRCLQKI